VFLEVVRKNGRIRLAYRDPWTLGRVSGRGDFPDTRTRGLGDRGTRGYFSLSLRLLVPLSQRSQRPPTHSVKELF
jgi:hypothetical protein